MILVTRKLTKKRFSSFVKKCESFRILKNKQENFKDAIQQIEWDNLLLGIDYDEFLQKDKKILLLIIPVNLIIERKRIWSHG